MSILLVGNALRRDMVIHPENDERNDQREEVQKKQRSSWWEVKIRVHTLNMPFIDSIAEMKESFSNVVGQLYLADSKLSLY